MKLYKYISIDPDSDDVGLFRSCFTTIKVSGPNDLNDPFEGFFSRSDLNKRIGCFSRVPPVKNDNCIYMWSFYANALKGICIEYDFYATTVKSFKHGKVSYENKTNINIFSKYPSWKAEKEYRFVLPTGSESFIPVENFGLTVSAVYLGVRLLGGHPVKINERNQKMRSHAIYKWIRQNLKNVPVHVCVRNRTQFKINSKILSEINPARKY